MEKKAVIKKIEEACLSTARTFAAGVALILAVYVFLDGIDTAVTYNVLVLKTFALISAGSYALHYICRIVNYEKEKD